MWLLMFALGSVSPVFASDDSFSFKHIDAHDGLSSSNVKCIARDRNGFMWFGGKNGLNRYDGREMVIYNCFDDVAKKGNNNIDALYVESDTCIWVGTDRGIFTYNPVDEKFSYVDRAPVNNPKKRADNWVFSISGDGQGNVWAVLPDVGIFRFYDGKAEYHNLEETSVFKKIYYSSLAVTKSGEVYAATSGDGIYKYEPKKARFRKLITSGDLSADGINFSQIIDWEDGRLVAGALDGCLYMIDAAHNNLFTPIPFSISGQSYLRALCKFDNSIWVGTQDGMYVVDVSTGKETLLKEDPFNRFSLSDNTIFCIFRDNEEDAWVGTLFGGVNFMSRRPFGFRKYGIESGMSSMRTVGMAVDSDGKIWIGTENGGVNGLDPLTGEITRHPLLPHGGDSPSISVTSYNGNVYSGSNHNGLYRIVSDSQIENMLPTPITNDDCVYAYLVDSRGDEWFGMSFALYRREAGQTELKKMDITKYDWVFDLFEAEDGAIWIGTMGNGLYRYDPKTGKSKNYIYNDGVAGSNQLRSNSISSIMQDSFGNVWISTDRGGLSRYNAKTDDFTTFGTDEGLPDNTVYKVLEDSKANLWFGTNKGLVKLNPFSNEVKTFTTADGLPGNQFSYHGAVAHPNGNFYFGSINGVVSFNPDLEEACIGEAPSLYFTSLNLPLYSGQNEGEVSTSRKSLLYQDEIELPQNRSTFSITVASPDFGRLGNTAFFYRLLPSGEEWMKMTGNTINFNNLAPGRYTLELKTGSGQNVTVKKLHITILPPWWKSTWAFISYGIVLALLAVGGVISYNKRKERQLCEREHKFEEQKEKELYRNKMQFFTEIAHEIRTPLSLIDIPLEAIEEVGLDAPDAKRYLKVTRQNTARLLKLTSQLLDFQKIDSNKLSLKNEDVNVTALLKETTERFEPAISVQGKQLEKDIESKSVYAFVDKEALTKILSNLLNNALKYASGTIRVTLLHDDSQLKISVASDGKKIPPEEHERIFEPFYQTPSAKSQQNGVGIGLPLARSLSTLLGGSLCLEDNPDSEFNVFTVTLPVSNAKVGQAEPIDIEKENYVLEEESNQTRPRSDGYHLLLVEDNDSIRGLLSEQLSRYFFIEEAANGKEALEKLSSHYYDIVVTDIMMPEMDGFELCQTIKAEPAFSHIPVVIITAKNDLESKIKGLQYGAEGYIEKPFSVKYLRQMVQSLLDNRRRERESFAKKPFFMVDNMQTNKADEEFMNKCIEIIRDHVSEEDFNVESLTDLMCMSRSNLLRKIKSLFNLSPSELIRVIKLKRAAELIQEGKYRINEICLMVGISSPSYFTKLFIKQFNVAPKDFAKQCRATSKPTSPLSED